MLLDKEIFETAEEIADLIMNDEDRKERMLEAIELIEQKEWYIDHQEIYLILVRDRFYLNNINIKNTNLKLILF